MVTVWGPSGTTLLFFVIPQYKDLAGWGWEQFRALAAQHCFFKSVIPRCKDLAGWGWELFGALATQHCRLVKSVIPHYKNLQAGDGNSLGP